MELTPRTERCKKDNCPRVFDADDGRVAVQGARPTDPGALAEIGPLPDHEGVVLIPRELLTEYVRLLEEPTS